MSIKVKVEISPYQEHHFEKGMKVDKLLKELQLNPENVIVIKGKQLLAPDDWVEAGEEVSIRSVISGG